MDDFTAGGGASPAMGGDVSVSDAGTATPDISSPTPEYSGTGDESSIFSEHAEQSTSETTPELTPAEPATAPQFASIEEAISHIEGLNQQITSAQSYAETHSKIEEYGGLDSVETLLALAGGLFAPVMDEATGAQVSDYREFPEYTAAPFVEQLAEISPSTLFEVATRALDMPYGQNGESLGHVLLREVLGVNPDLLSTYQQIQSLDQAVKFLPTDSQVDPADLATIPENLHAAFRSLDPELREEVLGLTDSNRDKVLLARDQMLELERRDAVNREYIEEQRQAKISEWNQRIEQSGHNLIEEARSSSLNNAFEDLKTKANFFGNDADNQIAWNDIVTSSANKIANEPTSQVEIQRTEDLLKSVAYYKAIGENWKAQQLKVEADRLVRKLDNRFKNEVTQRTKWWSTKLGATAKQQQSQPRIEIGKTPAVNAPPGIQTPKALSQDLPTGQRFGLSPARINELASQLAMKRVGHA